MHQTTLLPDRIVGTPCRDEFNLDELGRAASAYEAVLREKPGAPDALAGLERTHRQLGNGRALIELLRAS